MPLWRCLQIKASQPGHNESGSWEKCERTGRCCLTKDADKYAAELGLNLVLRHPNSTAYSESGEEVPKKKDH